MKVFIVLACLCICASASVLHHAPVLASTGTSSQSRTQDAAGNYAFAYNEQHATGGTSRSESGSLGAKQGSYTLNVADGRQRVVNYVADALGFRASIATNEPGTAAQPAANTAISSPYAPPQQVAPVAVAAAPVAVAAPAVAVSAPVAVAHHAPLAVHAPAVAPLAVAHHAPVLAHYPAVSSYSSVVNHGVLSHAPAFVSHGPAVLAAQPVAVAHHAPLAAPFLHY